MPESRVVEVESFRDGERKRSPSSSQQVKWDEIGGVMVPTSISHDAGYRTRKIGKQRFIVKKTVDVEIVWLSLNQPIDGSEFDKEKLVDIDKVIKELDFETLSKKDATKAHAKE